MSQSGDHLKSGPLRTANVTDSTLANIGAGIDFDFAFGVILVTAGVADVHWVGRNPQRNPAAKRECNNIATVGCFWRYSPILARALFVEC